MTNFEKEAFRLYGDGNPHIKASKTFAIAACTAVALCVYAVAKLLDTFGKQKMKAAPALIEFSKDLYQNPRCKRTSCSACTKIQPVTSITTTSGLTYQTTNSISMETKNCVYMVQCIKTGKMYIGMTTRKANTRVKEHLRDIAKERGKTLARHFNGAGCFGQFEQSMRIAPLAYVSDETMKPYKPSERKRIMEYIEAKLMELVGRGQLLNKKTPCTDFSGFDVKPNLDELFKVQEDGIYIDGRLTFSICPELSPSITVQLTSELSPSNCPQLTSELSPSNCPQLTSELSPSNSQQLSYKQSDTLHK